MFFRGFCFFLKFFGFLLVFFLFFWLVLGGFCFADLNPSISKPLKLLMKTAI